MTEDHAYDVDKYKQILVRHHTLILYTIQELVWGL